MTLFALVKPILLFPAIAGIPLGVGKDGTFQTTAILYFIASIFIVNMAQALGAAILNRYLFAFPSVLTKWFSFKTGIKLLLCTIMINYIGPMILLYPILKMDRDKILETALAQDSYLSKYFDEPAFLALPFESAKAAYFSSFTAFVLTLFVATFIITFLTYYVRSNKSIIFSKLQRSLIISAIIELAVSLIFLVIPLIAFAIIVCFQLPNTENWSIYIFSLIITHSFLQSIITLYFITPYRKFLCKILSNICTNHKQEFNHNRIYSIY
uniref:Serpentine Receptor, class H n=1 Tax=Panagrolaimus sp. PS1159 TaxID=55785 RepID=A0AC35GT44_9BILA